MAEYMPGKVISELFSDIHTGFVTVCGISAGGLLTRWVDLSKADAISAAIKSALTADQKGFDAYISTGTSSRLSDHKHRISKVDGMCQAAPALFMDIDTHADGVKDGKAVPDDIPTALESLCRLPTPPTMAVCSGHGIHAYWQLDKPIMMASAADAGKVTGLMRRFAKGVCSLCGDDWSAIDIKASEPARILRIDGTHNRKHGAALPVQMIYSTGSRIPLDKCMEMAAEEDQAPLKPLQAHTMGIVSRRININDADYLSIGIEKDEKLAAYLAGDFSGKTSKDNDTSESAQDYALMLKLLYWCNGNESLAIDAFLSSGYVAGKDHSHEKKLTGKYLEQLAGKAADDLHATAAGHDADYQRTRPLWGSPRLEPLTCPQQLEPLTSESMKGGANDGNR